MTMFIAAPVVGLALATTAADPAQTVDSGIRFSCIRW
jgi:hypothetical protein